MLNKKLAHYEIVDLLGKGGMGEVYRARDTKLERDVALKILPDELASDPERAARFQREARALASLQHPNVASIYGFEEVEGVRFLVMELVEGSDLAQRLRQGAIPEDEALNIARQLAAGLEAAHETGLVHRDLKPANIMLTPAGEVKILDFGLARAWFGDANDERDIAHSPTITAAMTQAGTILGTAAYMSPEQARGKNVDRRADIWAFGVILWEMLTGKQLFEGETVSDTLAAVLRAEPSWETLPAESAPVLCHLIERCLQRDPKRRLRDIGEARILLEGGEVGSSILGLSALGTPVDTSPAPRKGWPLPALSVIALVCLVLGSVLGWKVLAKPSPPQLLHLMIPPPENAEYYLDDQAPGPARISPDGTMITFTALDEQGVAALYLRYLDQPEAARLSGTEGAAYPFWSPDNRYIGFFSMKEGKLRKIAVRGGPPVTLCPASNGKGGSWNKDGVIIFAPSHDAVIHRVSDTGGDPIGITKFQGTEDSHRHPRFLPDGEHFLYLARQPNTGGMYSIYLASLDSTKTPRVITRSEAQAEYSEGNLLTVREGVLLATPFKLSDEKLTEGGTPLVDNIYVYSSGAAAGNYSASATGMLLYQTGSAVAIRFLQRTDLDSKSTSVLGESGQIYFPRISPDGKLAVVEMRSGDDESTDLWLVDLESGLRTRFTFAEGNESFPCWTPDGKYVIYGASHDSTFQIVKQPLEGTGSATVLVENGKPLRPGSVSPDGSMLLYDEQKDGNDVDMELLPLNPAGEPREFLATPQFEGGGQFSPDGRWVAYHGHSENGWDIFVRSAAGGARKWQVSTDGAVYPKWSPDGKQLWVTKFNGTITAFAVDGTGNTFQVGDAHDVGTCESPSNLGVAYDIYPDGKSILQAGRDQSKKEKATYLQLVTDWKRGLVQ